MNRLARRFVLIVGAIVTTLTIGTVGFTVIDGYPPFDAFYMTLTTMTTVGYGEIHPLSHAGRVFNSFLIAFGVTTIFIAIGAMTQTIIELEFGDAIGKRRNKRMIDKLKDHYIICGFGRVGRGASSELSHAGVPFVVVDINPDRVERAMLAGMLAVAGDSTHDDTLRLLGGERARRPGAAPPPAPHQHLLPPPPPPPSPPCSPPRASIRASTSPPAPPRKALKPRCGAPAPTPFSLPTPLPAIASRNPSCGPTSSNSWTSPPKTSARISPSNRCASPPPARWSPRPSRTCS